MNNYNLNDKKFKSIDNSSNGDISSDTVFHYRQEGNKVWATYAGGKIALGTIIGKIVGNEISLLYQQLNLEGEFLTGLCDTTISNVNGKLRLDEQWRWTCRDFSKGTSLLEEV